MSHFCPGTTLSLSLSLNPNKSCTFSWEFLFQIGWGFTLGLSMSSAALESMGGLHLVRCRQLGRALCCRLSGPGWWLCCRVGALKRSKSSSSEGREASLGSRSGGGGAEADGGWRTAEVQLPSTPRLLRLYCVWVVSRAWAASRSGWSLLLD